MKGLISFSLLAMVLSTTAAKAEFSWEDAHTLALKLQKIIAKEGEFGANAETGRCYQKAIIGRSVPAVRKCIVFDAMLSQRLSSDHACAKADSEAGEPEGASKEFARRATLALIEIGYDDGFAKIIIGESCRAATAGLSTLSDIAAAHTEAAFVESAAEERSNEPNDSVLASVLDAALDAAFDASLGHGFAPHRGWTKRSPRLWASSGKPAFGRAGMGFSRMRLRHR